MLRGIVCCSLISCSLSLLCGIWIADIEMQPLIKMETTNTRLFLNPRSLTKLCRFGQWLCEPTMF